MSDQTESQTENPYPKSYLSYRVTIDHSNVDKVIDLVHHYETEYLIWPHTGDQSDPNPHYHIIIPTEDLKLADRLRKRFREQFCEKGGNAFHASKFHVNGVKCAVAYLKHDNGGEPIYKGHYWSELIEHTLPATHEQRVAGVVGKRERLGEYVLTLSNVLKQADKYRYQNKIQSRSLYFIMFSMLQDGWTANRDILTRGIPEELYELWDVRTKPNRNNDAKLMFLMPHPRSAKSIEWNGVPVSLTRFND